MKYLKLADITAYRKSFELSNYVWSVVEKWSYFGKRTLGSQFVESVDSISANIAEGFGRFHRKDKQKFYFNARGSVYESLDWLQKAKIRKLVSKDEYEKIFQVLSELPREINALISYTEKHLSQ